MDYFKDYYGILALAATKENHDVDEDSSELKDFIGGLEIVLQSVKSKIFSKKDDPKCKLGNHY